MAVSSLSMTLAPSSSSSSNRFNVPHSYCSTRVTAIFPQNIITCSGDTTYDEDRRRLGMGTNMYPSSALLGQNKDESISALPVDELIEKADGFAGVFPAYIWGFNS